MENYTQKLRDAANKALVEGGLVRNAYDLAQKADMDPGNLSKFLKAKEGKYDRISFSNAAAILGAIGGEIAFPPLAARGAADAAFQRRLEELAKENEKLRNKLEALQEVLTGMCTAASREERKPEDEKKQGVTA